MSHYRHILQSFWLPTAAPVDRSQSLTQGKKQKCKSKMAFAIRFRTPLPPLKGTNFHPFFYPTCFLLQLNPKYMKRILNFVPLKHIPPFMVNAILNFHFFNISLSC